MNIITSEFSERIENKLIPLLQKSEFPEAANVIEILCNQLYADIPDEKRISYGRVFVIRTLGKHLYSQLNEKELSVFSVSASLFKYANNLKTRSVALCILSFDALQDFKAVLPYFEKAAADENWDIREMAQMFFRKIIKSYPEQMHTFLLKLVKSEDANMRRFVAETLRPVQENRWFYKEPEYSLSILRRLFREKAAYPRTAVGNNLSDMARRLPDLVYTLVEELVACGDKNSYWIAYRACRNLVKKEPIRVMDILKTDEYKYKKRIHKRSDYQRN